MFSEHILLIISEPTTVSSNVGETITPLSFVADFASTSGAIRNCCGDSADVEDRLEEGDSGEPTIGTAARAVNGDGTGSDVWEFAIPARNSFIGICIRKD